MAIRTRSSASARPRGSRLRTAQQPARLPPGIASVLSVLSSSAVVVDSNDRVLRASAAARAFGLVKGDRLMVSELAALARQVRRDGEIREGEFEVPVPRFGGRTTSFAVRVAPLGAAVGGGGLVLVLAEDQTESRRVDEVKRDFVANTSHELKTPVGALALLAETIEDAADDAEAVRRFAGKMRQEAQRLTNLVQDLITLSRIQAVEPVPDPRPVDLDLVVAEALDRCRMKANARGITLASTGTRGLSVLGDEDLLITALRNLLENAVAYSPERTRVVITLKRSSDGTAELSVADQGIGIPERDLERIFERFYRVDPARSRATGGTGLGLAIVKHVMAAHNGRVTVRSVEGAGLDVHPVHSAAKRACQHGRGLIPGETQVTRVLVVEDEDSFSDAISYLLRKEGFEVAVCSTGPDALDTFDRTGADLVLLDLMLPGLPGSEVCRSLREKSNVPVIMLTAKDSEIDKVVGLELGADDYVTKPFSSRELVARMRAVLRRRGEPEDVAESALESGPVRMDVDRHVVTVRGGTVQLPLKEFELLQVLLRNADRVLTRMQLIDRVWGADYVGDTKTLDVHIKRLRAKIEVDPAHPQHIVTVRGLGYKFESVG